MQGIRGVLHGEVETHALADVNFEIKKGEYTSPFRDRPAAARRRSFRFSACARHRERRRVLLAGESVATLAPADRARVRNRQIGFIFQAFNLIVDLTVFRT